MSEQGLSVSVPDDTSDLLKIASGLRQMLFDDDDKKLERVQLTKPSEYEHLKRAFPETDFPAWDEAYVDRLEAAVLDVDY